MNVDENPHQLFSLNSTGTWSRIWSRRNNNNRFITAPTSNSTIICKFVSFHTFDFTTKCFTHTLITKDAYIL